jgi:hypothetical protein
MNSNNNLQTLRRDLQTTFRSASVGARPPTLPAASQHAGEVTKPTRRGTAAADAATDHCRARAMKMQTWLCCSCSLSLCGVACYERAARIRQSALLLYVLHLKPKSVMNSNNNLQTQTQDLHTTFQFCATASLSVLLHAS